MTRHGVHDLVAGILVSNRGSTSRVTLRRREFQKGWIRLTVDVPATAVAELQQFVTALAHKQNGRSRAGNKGKPGQRRRHDKCILATGRFFGVSDP